MLKTARIPLAPRSIIKGTPLKTLLDAQAIDCLINNLSLVYPQLNKTSFKKAALHQLAPLSLIERGHHLATVMKTHLPEDFKAAIEVIIQSLTPPLDSTSDNGLAVFFYLPHITFVAKYGLGKDLGSKDYFDTSMNAQYELTKRFTAEFSIRSFLNTQPDRTLSYLFKWIYDPCPHVRRLCSEGTRPRLPWAARIPQFIKDPSPTLPILEALKDDPELYVRRSVANHLADIAKDHLDLALNICSHWLKDASKERKWVIRHALRYPCKKGIQKAIKLRQQATHKP